MKHGILSFAWLAAAGLALAAPPQARLQPLEKLMEWR